MSAAIANPARTARPVVTIGGLPIDASSLAATARAYVDYCSSAVRRSAARPHYATSANGHVISLCARSAEVERLFRSADSISADGQPMVALSRILSRHRLPERVATTDLFPEVARLAAEAGLSFYMLGATESANRKAVEATRRAYPNLRIVGHRDGYFTREDEPRICAEIAAAEPDILWVSLGVPLEQEFCVRNLDALRGVGIVKTAGGLFDFISGEKPRAPDWMQRAGFEWLFRLWCEPRRLFLRYAGTSPHAVLVMLLSMR
jgi:N-acetylglucosaminyldiphosphoundecaprenol N-acetyl-beta-D-mannosaminyltransferase